jgi:ATP-dependent Clp protease adaptor protein ClpS
MADRKNNTKNDSREGTQVLDRPETKPKLQEPSSYKVILLNDDYTPMEFVIQILKKFFNKNKDQAEIIMLQVHKEGRGVAGIFTFEVAETKMHLVNTYSDQQKHPLQCIIEKD